jgi:2-aminoadipate transaminase
MKPEQLRFAKRMGGISGSAIREILKLTSKPGIISFAGGNPGNFALPNMQIAEIAGDLLQKDGKLLLQYGVTDGYKPLRESLTQYIKEEFSAGIDAAQILPVSGSSQAMDLLCRAYIDPGDTILVENPTFLGNMQCMRLYEANLIPVNSDEDGLIPEALEEAIIRYHPKMLYTIPTFQNPTGITLSLARRRKVAEMAEKYSLLVAEDDPYRSLRYAGSELPSIKSFDREGWVVLMGSFSKVISPGLRVGFMAADEELLRKCIICKQSSDVHTPTLNQAIVDAYLRRGLLAPHLRNINVTYKAQMETMLNGLAGIPSITHFTKPEGGLFTFAYLRDSASAYDLFNRAVSKGVAFVPGTSFYTDGGHLNTFRLNFSSSDVNTITAGLEILKSCME